MVYQAKWRGIDVAVKMLKDLEDDEALEDFKKESALMGYVVCMCVRVCVCVVVVVVACQVCTVSTLWCVMHNGQQKVNATLFGLSSFAIFWFAVWKKNSSFIFYFFSKLRHPNVVLFMGASTEPNKMCIVTGKETQISLISSLLSSLPSSSLPSILLPLALPSPLALPHSSF